MEASSLRIRSHLRIAYLEAAATVDRDLQSRGYLNELGFNQMQEVARELWTRVTGRTA